MESKSVKKGEQFTISLASNPTTGFSWQAKPINESFVRLVHNEYQKPSSSDKFAYHQLYLATHMPGAGGQHLVVFEATGTGETDIVLEYKRPWETNVGKTHNLHVAILE